MGDDVTGEQMPHPPANLRELGDVIEAAFSNLAAAIRQALTAECLLSSPGILPGHADCPCRKTGVHSVHRCEHGTEWWEREQTPHAPAVEAVERLGATSDTPERGEAAEGLTGFLTDERGRCPRCGDTNSVDRICLTCADPCAPSSAVHWAGIVDALKAELDRLRARLEAVRALHTPVFTQMYDGTIRAQCDYCVRLCHSGSGLHCDEPYDAEWPCDTIQALDGE